MSAPPSLPPQVEWFLSQPCTVYVAVVYDDGSTAMLDLDGWARDRRLGQWVRSEIVDPREHSRQLLTRMLVEDSSGAPVRIEGEDIKAPAA